MSTVCVPVSYTHLDVYKRQIYDRMQAFDDRSAGIMAAVLLVMAVVTLMATTTLSQRLVKRRG